MWGIGIHTLLTAAYLGSICNKYVDSPVAPVYQHTKRIDLHVYDLYGFESDIESDGTDTEYGYLPIPEYIESMGHSI